MPSNHGSPPCRYALTCSKESALLERHRCHIIQARRELGPNIKDCQTSILKVTPRRLGCRQTTRHGRVMPSVVITKLNSDGIPRGLSTANAAPVADKFFTVQSIAPPSNSMVPAFKTRERNARVIVGTESGSVLCRYRVRCQGRMLSPPEDRSNVPSANLIIC